MERNTLLPRVALASAVLLVVLCTTTFVTGTSQQWFEWAHAPDVYADALRAHATWLRAIIALDDVFIAAYVSMALLFGVHLAGREHPKSPLLLVAMGFSVVAGTLDLEENHHLLSLLRLAEAGVAIPLEEVVRRSDLSQLKWMLGHVAFAMIGLSLAPRSQTARLFQSSLVCVQLPLGALTWAVTEGALLTTLVWVRYGALVSGFVMVAWLTSRPSASRGADDAIATGVPA